MEPLEKWEGEYKAIDDVPTCPQANVITATEDCLRLNVYVPHMVYLLKIIAYSYMSKIIQYFEFVGTV